MSRKRPNYGQKTMNLPLFGEVSIFSLAVLVFSVAFAVLWIATRRQSFSWFGQDVLVSFNSSACALSLSVIIADSELNVRLTLKSIV
jgi:hypothetical protein